MKKSELNKLLKKWQPRLRLQDWAIKLRWATTKERKEGDYYGLTLPVAVDKSAEIIIVNPRYIKTSEGAEDTELLLVHELLHLHFVPFKTKGHLEVAEENVVYTLARLLVALDRGDESVLEHKLPACAGIMQTLVMEFVPEAAVA